MIPQRPPLRCGIWRLCPLDLAGRLERTLRQLTAPRPLPRTSLLSPIKVTRRDVALPISSASARAISSAALSCTRSCAKPTLIAPGSAADVSLFSIWTATFSDNGQVLISGYLDGPGIPRLDISGVWLGSTHQPLAYVARLKAPAQGFELSVTYDWVHGTRLAGGEVSRVSAS